MPRPTINGVRKHVILTKQQDDALSRYAKKTGLTVAEQIRRAVDFYLANAAERTTRKPA
jgi:hypothetical protein